VVFKALLGQFTDGRDSRGDGGFERISRAFASFFSNRFGFF
jgi:hypothetical protein